MCVFNDAYVNVLCSETSLYLTDLCCIIVSGKVSCKIAPTHTVVQYLNDEVDKYAVNGSLISS